MFTVAVLAWGCLIATTLPVAKIPSLGDGPFAPYCRTRTLTYHPLLLDGGPSGQRREGVPPVGHERRRQSDHDDPHQRVGRGQFK
jgi:hypothetical protein